MVKNKSKRKHSSKEDKLRQKIITFLDNNKFAEERIIDTCGNSEYGADIIFSKLDAFGKLRLYGAQIKTGNISCKTKPNRGIKEIIGQILIAFGHSFDITVNKGYIEGFYVITDGEFIGNAKSYIESATRSVRNLYLIGKQDLEEFFVKQTLTSDKYRPT